MFYYKNLFIYSSLQSIGHVEEYFMYHTEKLVVFIVMPRVKNKGNLLRFYKMGKLIEEQHVYSSSNIILYYLSWYCHYWFFILRYFTFNEPFIVFSGHPISFFGMGIQKLFRRITYAYWIGDYFPPVSFSLRLYEQIKKFYHDRVSYAYYLSDRINKKMNGQVVNNSRKQTVMWGVLPKNIKHNSPRRKYSLLFVGLIKKDQGLDFIFNFLKNHKQYDIKIIGICDNRLFQIYKNLIKKLEIEERVYFPNNFFSDQDLTEIAKTSHIGIALYRISKLSSTYYTDPGKIKTYTELGLPVIMSNISAIASYIKRWKAGEVISWKYKVFEETLLRVSKNYTIYEEGVRNFNKHFYFEDYYSQAFTAFRNI